VEGLVDWVGLEPSFVDLSSARVAVAEMAATVFVAKYLSRQSIRIQTQIVAFWEM
jgi:chorismate synthase